MKLVVLVMKFLQWPVYIVPVNQAHPAPAKDGPIGAVCGMGEDTTKMIIAKSPVAAGSKRNRTEVGTPRLRFWVLLVWQTLSKRDLLPLSREMQDAYVVTGLEHIPEKGVFSLAVNHTLKRWTPRLLATIHQASLEKRPDLAGEWLVIVGYRETRLEGRSVVARWLIPRIRRFHQWIYQRWQYNVIRLPMFNERSSIQSLREWKERAKRQPTMVFPEGRGAKTFEEIRPGAGRWLSVIGVPVLPVSIWWDRENKGWQIIIGPPIEWSENPQLHDLQLGLEIAAGLPPDEAPLWQEHLVCWQAATSELFAN